MQRMKLNADIERRLFELAERTGRTAAELMEEGIEELEYRYGEEAQRVKPTPSSRQARKELGTRRAAEWLNSVKDLPHTPPLSDEVISRETMYESRG